MSAIGHRVAIVSLGLSCQTSRQIDANIPLLRQLTGDGTLDKTSLPFDWLISSASGLAGMMQDRSTFPASHEELVADQGRLRLRSHNILYWHESALLASAGEPRFDDTKAKFRFTTSRFEQIAKLDRVIAVMSDTQHNLPWIEESWRMPLINTGVEAAERARDAFGSYLGRAVDLLLVSRNPRPDFIQRPDLAYYQMVPAPLGWAGNKRDWTQVWKDYFGPRTLKSVGQPNA